VAKGKRKRVDTPERDDPVQKGLEQKVTSSADGKRLRADNDGADKDVEQVQWVGLFLNI
jgi:hypothetical protein